MYRPPRQQHSPARSGALRGFVDRLLSRFARAYEKYRPAETVARRGTNGGGAVARAKSSLEGLGLLSRWNRLLIRDAHLLPSAGFLVREMHSVAGLGDNPRRPVLPVRVEPFRRLLPVAPAEQTRLRVTRRRGGDGRRYHPRGAALRGRPQEPAPTRGTNLSWNASLRQALMARDTGAPG